MRHRNASYKLGRSASHRAAMERNFISSLILHERVVTTVEKAKHLRPKVEKMITLGRKKSLHRFRRALSRLQNEDAARKLFDDIGPRFADRPGGYTRIVRLGSWRIGDGGEKAILELVENNVLERQIEEAEVVE